MLTFPLGPAENTPRKVACRLTLLYCRWAGGEFSFSSNLLTPSSWNWRTNYSVSLYLSGWHKLSSLLGSADLREGEIMVQSHILCCCRIWAEALLPTEPADTWVGDHEVVIHSVSLPDGSGGLACHWTSLMLPWQENGSNVCFHWKDQLLIQPSQHHPGRGIRASTASTEPEMKDQLPLSLTDFTPTGKRSRAPLSASMGLGTDDGWKISFLFDSTESKGSQAVFLLVLVGVGQVLPKKIFCC